MLKNMKVRFGIVVLAVGIFLLSAVIIFNHDRKDTVIYGNDQASIIEAIQSTKGSEASEIEIVDITDIDDNRIVGFYLDNEPGYVQFTKNEDGNYKQVAMQTGGNLNLEAFLIRALPKTDHPPMFMIITSEENKVAELELGVNDEVIHQEIQTGQQAVHWIELADTDKHRFAYKYFDEDGEQITP